MKRYVINITLFLALLGFCSAGNAAAPVSHSSDWTLSMLRGSWEYHTFDDKWTLDFQSDHNLVFDRNDAGYSLLPGSLRIMNESDTTDYPYALNGNKLTLQLPGGSERTYNKKSNGAVEQMVSGNLYATIDSTGRKAHLFFDGSRAFSLADEIGEGTGLYRVEGSTIFLALNDTTTYSTQIRSWNSDGSLGELVFEDRLYASERPVVEAEPVRPIVVYVPGPEPPMPPPDPPYPGPPPRPPEPPPYPIYPPPPPAPPTPVASAPPSRPDNTSAERPVRPFGSKRPPNN
jgi:hypothetical protein